VQLLSSFVHSFLRRCELLRQRLAPASSAYRLLSSSDEADSSGWRAEAVARRQHLAYEPLLEAARAGRPRQDFVVAVQALGATGLSNPDVIEIGCGSGYYCELLPLLLGRPIRYRGVDFSPEMVSLARRTYPAESFLAGDARGLPFRDNAADVVISGNSLMHIPEFDCAIRETARVARYWCIFHTVPVMERRPTTRLRKRAYGRTVFELIFNRAELERAFASAGLRVEAVYESIPYDVSAVVHEPTMMLTYLCKRQ
jgi:ubiquinone/menaquinone biosynthesis C-methylase UbiE